MRGGPHGDFEAQVARAEAAENRVEELKAELQGKKKERRRKAMKRVKKVAIPALIVVSIIFGILVATNTFGWFDFTEDPQRDGDQVLIRHNYGFLWFNSATYEINLMENGNYDIEEGRLRIWCPRKGMLFIGVSRGGRATRVSLPNLQRFVCGSYNPLGDPVNLEVCETAQRIWNRWDEELNLHHAAIEVLAAPPSEAEGLDENVYIP